MISTEKSVANKHCNDSVTKFAEPHSGRRVVSLSKTYSPLPKVLVIPRKRWLRANMTEKLFTGTLSIKPLMIFDSSKTKVNPLDKLVVVHELEFAVQRAL